MLTPRPYQIVGREFLASRTRALLADEMRVGKTPQAILAAEKRGAESIVVLCPAIAVPHWTREFRRWWTPGLATMPRLDLYSYDRARSAWQTGDLKKQRWDVMIVDEAHFAKNPEAARTQMVYGKRGLGYQAGAIWALSGTPAPKHAGELWPMLRAFGVVDMTYDAFCARYCARWWNKQRMEWVIKGTREDRIPELKELLATVMLRRTRKEVAPDMPDIDFQFLEVSPRGLQDLAVPVGLSDEDLLPWLESHARADSADRQEVATAKVVPLAEEIGFAIGNDLLKQTVVFGWHTLPLQALAWRLNQHHDVSAETLTGDTSPAKREKVQASFRRGETQVVCANILAAGTAIDLSSASHAYFLELDWVPGNNLQAVNRLVSMQKGEKVTADIVTWPGSADDRVQRVLTQRVREINQLV